MKDTKHSINRVVSFQTPLYVTITYQQMTYSAQPGDYIIVEDNILHVVPQDHYTTQYDD